MKCDQYKVRICSWVPFTRLIGSWSISTSGMGLRKTHWSLTQHPKPTTHLKHSHFFYPQNHIHVKHRFAMTHTGAFARPMSIPQKRQLFL